MLDRLKIGRHITLFPEWLIEWEYRAMDFDVGAEWIFSVNSESGEIEALEAVEITSNGNPSELALASFFCWQRKNIGGRGKRCKGQGTIRRRAALASFPVLCTLKKQKMR